MAVMQDGTIAQRTPQAFIEAYRSVRRYSEQLCEPLATEDYVVQAMPDASPPKWHLAHTSWFFETFILQQFKPGHVPMHPGYNYLFNSYYNAVGERHSRPQRGLISRPTVAETYQYRRHVDDQMIALLEQAGEAELAELEPLLTLGLNHEQQHQELLVTDLAYNFSVNPLRPAYLPGPAAEVPAGAVPPLRWCDYAGGLVAIGHDGKGFAYDNEGPRHQVYLHPYQLASRLTTNAEYMAFLDDGGYARPEFWLSDGWNTVRSQGWQAPLYWEKQNGEWWAMTVRGMQRVNPAAPVCHVSYYEADAFARWSGARLATEAEWENAAEGLPLTGHFAEAGRFQPAPLDAAAAPAGRPAQLFGDLWEWTQSHYSPYPGYQAAPGAVGEYNGKFMCNQFVLRGGSCATPASHIRRTYRNFFPADARWQFSGIRLAKGGPTCNP